MVATIDMEFLYGIGPEAIVKELALVSDGFIQTFLFKPPYPMHAHVSEENGLNWDDGHIPYDQLNSPKRNYSTFRPPIHLRERKMRNSQPSYKKTHSQL